MPADIPSSETGAVEFLIEKTEDGIVTSFSDLKKYPEFEFISEQDAR